MHCHLLLAQTHYLEGDIDGAVQSASFVQRLDPEDGRANILLCQVYLHQNKLSSARLALDEAVAASFKTRNLMKYHIVNAQVLLAENRLLETKHVSSSRFTLAASHLIL